MRRNFVLLAICLAVAACAVSTAFAGATAKFSDDQVGKYTIPYISKSPTIDGVIGDVEWKDSVKVMGVIGLHYGGQFIDRPISFRVAWDERHLYIAARTDILPGHRLYRQKRERYDTGVVYDDSWEFGIFMHDRNKKAGEASGFMKLVVNSLGSGEYMKLYPSIGQNMYNWQPDMQIQNRLYKVDGREWWDIEIAADLEDLEMPVENKVGDKVDLLFAADVKNPGWQWLDYPSASLHLEHYGFPRAILTKDQPYIQIERFSGLSDNKIDLKAVIYNPGDKPAALDAKVTVDFYPTGKEGEKTQSVVDDMRTVTVPAKGSVRFDLDKSFPEIKYPKTTWGTFQNYSLYRINIASAGDASAAPVYYYECKFAGPDTTNLTAIPRTAVFDCEMQYNPVNGHLLLSGDTLDAQIPSGTKVAAMTYAVTRDGETVKQGKITQYVNYKYEDMIVLPNLASGEYKVKLTLVDASGRELVSLDDIKFSKKDEAKDYSAWWNNKLGDSDKVLKPFAPLVVKANSVTCTRREYKMDSLGLPAQIISNGGKLLTRPAQIVLTIGGKEYAVPVKGTVKFTSKKDYRVEFVGPKTEVAGVVFSSKGWMEQDGLVNIDLTYAPKSKPVQVQAMRVEWPVDGAMGSWMNCIGGIGGNYAPRTIGKVPGGKGMVWDTLSGIGKAGSTMIVGNWESNLWVGNEYRGLCWFADSDKGWVPNDKIPAHALVRKGNEVAICNNIIGQTKGEAAFKLSSARTIQLQYNATPFRHLAKGWRLNQVSAANGFSASYYKTNEKTKEDYFSILCMPSSDTNDWPYYYDKYKKSAEENSKKGFYSIGPRLTWFLTNQIALRGYMDKTLEPGLYDYFRADWVPGNESLNKSYTDYMIYLMNRHMREGGVTHYYFDISFSRDAVSLPAGLGYRLPDGRVQPTSMDGTLRDWYKRVWALAQENDLYPGAVSGHATNSICLRALPWADAILDSEYPMQDPITVYPPDRMIAASYPGTFGVKIDHLGFMNPHWAGMHDSGQGGGGGMLTTPEFRHYGITREDVRFVPYWRNASIVKKTGQGLMTSIWRRPGAAIIAVLNYGLDPADEEKTRACDITLNLAALGIPAGAKGEMLRVRDLFSTPQIVDSHLKSYKWYNDIPQSDVPGGYSGQRDKISMPVTPTLDAKTGRVSGFGINYHEVRYVLVTWDETPINDKAWKSIILADQRKSALEWGVNTAVLLTPAETAKVVKADGVKVNVWKQPGTVMLRVVNPSDKALDATITLDQAKLGVKVKKLWAQFVQCLGGELNAETGVLIVSGIKPGESKMVYIDLN